MKVFGFSNAGTSSPREIHCETNTDAYMLLGSLEQYYDMDENYDEQDSEEIRLYLEHIKEIMDR